MSRPKPFILLSRVDPKKVFKSEQILAATAIYAVFYDGQPINLRTLDQVSESGPKYKKVSFSNPGHAFNLRSKLNETFKTEKFHVVKLTSGDVIEEHDTRRD